MAHPNFQKGGDYPHNKRNPNWLFRCFAWFFRRRHA